jgi:hypothetical protein
MRLSSANQDVTIEVRGVMTATSQSFNLTHELHAWEGENRVFTTEWNKTINRTD